MSCRTIRGPRHLVIKFLLIHSERPPVLLIHGQLKAHSVRPLDLAEGGPAEIDARAKDTTQRAIGPTLLVGQLVGLLPMQHILNYSAGASGLAFRWHSIRVIYAAFLIAFSLIELAMAVRRMFRIGFSLGGATVIFFYGSTTSTAVLMFCLASSGRWRRLMLQFEKVDTLFLDHDTYPVKWTLRKKVGTLTAVVIGTALLEHGLYLLAKMTNVWAQIQKCQFKIHFYEHFLRTERKHLFAVIPFSFYMAVPFEITNTCNTIAWTFLDLFIMIYSIALAHRFDQISRRIRRILLQVRP